jgi:hypothetical protein
MNVKYKNSQDILVLGFCLKLLNKISLMRQENHWIAALVDNTNLVKYQDCYFGLRFLCLTYDSQILQTRGPPCGSNEARIYWPNIRGDLVHHHFEGYNIRSVNTDKYKLSLLLTYT